ncbi:hypothetical protein DVH05_026482 [Phytophthora capsici]|nr:hypothetical protein DVH05_026482 [Phytophthora capsici]
MSMSRRTCEVGQAKRRKGSLYQTPLKALMSTTGVLNLINSRNELMNWVAQVLVRERCSTKGVTLPVTAIYKVVLKYQDVGDSGELHNHSRVILGTQTQI